MGELCEIVRLQEDPRVPRQAYALLTLLVDQVEALELAIKEAESEINA